MMKIAIALVQCMMRSGSGCRCCSAGALDLAGVFDAADVAGNAAGEASGAVLGVDWGVVSDIGFVPALDVRDVDYDGSLVTLGGNVSLLHVGLLHVGLLHVGLLHVGLLHVGTLARWTFGYLARYCKLS
jgi:hypothetical protein